MYLDTETDIRTIGTLAKTGPVRDAQQTKQCIYNIPRDCCGYYIGETQRPLEVCIKEHQHNLTQDLLEKSKLAQHCLRKSPQHMLHGSGGLAD
jgi:hypothetical protein